MNSEGQVNNQVALTPCEHLPQLRSGQKKKEREKQVLAIFETFNAVWGVKWCAHLNNPELAIVANRIWGEAIADLENTQIERAIKKLAYTCEWVPTVAQFRKAALNIVGADEAYYEAKNNHKTDAVYSNPAIYHAAASIISWDWANLTEQELKSKFSGAYKFYVEKLLMGEL